MNGKGAQAQFPVFYTVFSPLQTDIIESNIKRYLRSEKTLVIFGRLTYTNAAKISMNEK